MNDTMNGRRRAAGMLALMTLGAIALRLLMFTGRGDYVAFDEGWYLLLGRSLLSGDGYSLAGFQHTVLSPLFPILAGAMSFITGDIIWAGRVVAALCAGLLVVPCWFLFRRLADERTAWIGCLIVIAVPTLAPFTVPFWIDWDLWVGAEPVLHLFLYTGLALALCAHDTGRITHWIPAGLAFALAYLARPEAILVLGFLGLILGLHALVTRTPRRILGAAVLGITFCIAALPYWLYLHDVLDRWTITGRPVAVRVAPSGDGTGQRRSTAESIEQMLWGQSSRSWARSLYGLDETGVRLRSSYWGVPRDTPAVPAVTVQPQSAVEAAVADTMSQENPQPEELPSRWVLYGRGLVRAVPWYLLIVGLTGLLWSPGRRDGALIVTLPLLLTSVAIAAVIGVDPRTQLFLAPIVAFHAARAILALTAAISARKDVTLRPEFVRGLLAGLLLLALFTVQARWLYLSFTVPSPHHRVGAANHAVGAALQEIVPPDEPVMSWHPAIALFADRDWRVLPYAAFNEIVQYAGAIGCETVVLSAFYPGSQFIRDLPRDHLVLTVPPGTVPTDGMSVEIQNAGEAYIAAELRTAGTGS